MCSECEHNLEISTASTRLARRGNFINNERQTSVATGKWSSPEKVLVGKSSEESQLPKNATLETSPEKPHRVLRRWILALCIISVGGQLFTEISGTFISTIVHFGAGFPYAAAGIINAIFNILQMVCFIVFGAVSDNMRSRLGRRMPLIFLGMVSTAFLLYVFTLSMSFLWLLIDGGVFIAVTSALILISSCLTPDLVPLEKRGRINTLQTVVTPIGSAIIWIPSLVSKVGSGSFAGEMSIIQWSAVILGILGIMAFPLVQEPKVLEPQVGWVKDLKETLDWKSLRKQKDFFKLFVANFFLAAAGNAIFLNLFNFIGSINFDLIQVAIYAPIALAIMGAGIYFLGRSIDRIGRKWVTMVGLIFSPLGAILITISGGAILVLMLGFAIFFPFYWGGTTAITSWQQDILPKEARGKFFGLIRITSAAGSAVGAIVSSVIADRFSIFWIFVAASLFLYASLPILNRVPETLIKKKNQTRIQKDEK
jgi:MFS family permease